MKFIPVAIVTLALSGMALAFQEKAAAPAAPDAAAEAKLTAEVIAQQLPSYPLTQCPVSHESLESTGKPMDVVSEGRLVRFCCKNCVKEFKKDPATAAGIFKQIDEGVIQAQKASYPLKTCPISGETLGGMGEPLDVVQGTRLVRLCCKGCVKGFQKDPAKVMAQIDTALITEQKKTYALTTCLVGGEPLGSTGVDQLYGVHLTRFCSDKCATAFAQEPAKYMAALDKAAPKKN